MEDVDKADKAQTADEPQRTEEKNGADYPGAYAKQMNYKRHRLSR